MTEADWNAAPIADLLLHTLDIHRAPHGAEPADTAMLRPPQSAFRCDLSRKHVLLAFGVVRRYWNHLAPKVRRTIKGLEASEEAPGRNRDPLEDKYVRDMDLLGKHWRAAEGETAMALWLVAGWWPEVKSLWSDQDLPVSWCPLFDDVFGDAFCPVPLHRAHLTPTIASLARAAYDERQLPSGELEPHRLAVLADALEEVGAPAEMVEHLRGQGPHVRGCFAVDLCLGRS